MTVNLEIYATKGTAQFLAERGMQTTVIEKSKEAIEELVKREDIHGALIIPTNGSQKETYGKYLRELFLRKQVPLFTSIDTFKSIINLPSGKHYNVKSIQSYLGNFLQIS